MQPYYKVMNIVTKSLIILVLAGCSSAESDSDLVFAMNVGGEAYHGVDGTLYAAEESVSGGEIHRLASVKGSQDPILYQTYRRGNIVIAHPIEDGVYDVTFHFAEPDDDVEVERLFDVFVDGLLVFDDLDVRSSRDGQIHSALTVTAPNVRIDDGELNIHFEASVRQALLSALVVRSKNRPNKDWRLVWSDEFNSDGAPDPNNWTMEEWEPGVVNSEDQAYTARTKFACRRWQSRYRSLQGRLRRCEIHLGAYAVFG
jgi:hypothetical protein